MTKTLPGAGASPCSCSYLSGYCPFVYSSDQHSRINRTLPNDPSGSIARVSSERVPSSSDWTNRHSLYSMSGKSGALEAARIETPEQLMRWREVEQTAVGQRLERSRLQQRFLQFGIDLAASVPVARNQLAFSRTGASTWARAEPLRECIRPSTHSTSTAAPSCTNDFVVFPVNANCNHDASQIVALQLSLQRHPGQTAFATLAPVSVRLALGGSNTTSAAVVIWSYNVHASLTVAA